MALESSKLETARAIAGRTREASHALANATREKKDAVLHSLEERLESKTVRELLFAANDKDLQAARRDGMAAAMLDRLTLSPARVDAMIKGLREVAALPDPVGEVSDESVRPNGMHVSRVSIPLGVILMIYESRPNVTVDAASLCIKSGNGVILRGGKEALESNAALAKLCRDALVSNGLPADACSFVSDPDREVMLALLQQDDLIDLAIPRGGEGLIRFVAEHSRVPVIKHYKGVCHLYVDSAADLAMAVELAWDGKVSKPSACNALECLLVHSSVAARFLPLVADRLTNVELRAEPRAREILGSRPSVKAAKPDDFGREFLELTLAVKVVDSYDEAVEHILRYGSSHTECIVTGDAETAKRFLREVEASMVGWNVSTRFNDGGELGLGAEMGISTTKLHAFGPMGLREMTARKFVATGDGQVRR